MRRSIVVALAAALAFGAAVCSETTSPQQGSLSLLSAFQSVLGGYSSTHNSFAGGDSFGCPPHEGRGHHGPGPRGDMFGGRELMGGGLGGEFLP